MINKVNQMSYVLVFKALLHEPQSFNTLQEITGLGRSTLYKLFRDLRKHKVVHISGWDPDRMGRDAFPIFTLGAGKDKPKFRMTTKEVKQRYQERQAAKKQAQEIMDAMTNMVKITETL